MSDIILDGWTENDRDRRKSENKFTTFLNRSTQSLSLVRSKSKEGKSRTSDRSTKDKNAKGQAMVLDCSLQTSGERNTCISQSRLPTFSSTHDKRPGLQVKTASTRPAEYIHGTVLAISTAAGTATTTTAIGASGRRSVSPLQTDANAHTLPRYTQPKCIGSSSNSKSPYSTYSRASTRSPTLSSSPTTRSPVSTSITPKAGSRLPTLSMGVSSSSSHAAQASSSSPISTTSVNAAAVVVRSVTPTSTTSSTGRKMFGLLSRKSSVNAGTGTTTTTTPTAKSATATTSTTTTQTAPTRPSSQDERTAGHVKWGSLSSRTPLLPIDSRGSDESLLLLRRTASESKRASPPLSPIRSSTKSRDSMLTLKLKTGSTTSAADVVRKRSSSKLEFWRSSRTNAHTPVPDEKGKQKNVDITEQGRKEKEKGSKVKTQSTIVSPQPRAPVAFLPIPRLSRTPPAPDKGGVGVGARAVAPVSSRIDSFMSDSMPLPLPTTESSSSGAGTGTGTDTTTPVPVAAVAAAAAAMSATATDKTRLTTPKQDATIMTRHTHFAKPESDNTKEPMPRAKSAPASGGGGTVGKGRSSPCLRIPSPKFLHRDKDKDKEKEKVRDRKERRLTPECVSSPILRDRPIPKARVNKGEKSSQGQNQQRHYQAPTYSIVPVVKKARRITHGSFDFERPGSRSSSKSGVSDPKSSSCRSEEGDASGVKTPVVPTTAITTTITTTTRVTEMGVLRKESVSAHGHRSPTTRLRTLEHVDEAEPVPPLPTITSRLGRKSSLHRARKSPSPTNAYSPRAPHSPLYSTSASSATHDDDADLPRLTSSLARRRLGVGGVRRGQIVHPAFEFEPVGYARPSVLSHGSSVVPYSLTTSLTPRPVGGVYTTDITGATHKLRPKDANTPTQQHYYEHHQPRRVEHVVDSRTGLLWAPLPLKENGDNARPRSPLRVGNGGGGRKGKEVNWAKIEAEVAAGQDVDMISPKALEEATEVIGALKNVLNDAGFTTLQKYVRRFDSQVIPLDGSTGLIARVQRLLDTSAPRADERQKRQLLDSFRRVVCQTSH